MRRNRAETADQTKAWSAVSIARTTRPLWTFRGRPGEAIAGNRTFGLAQRIAEFLSWSGIDSRVQFFEGFLGRSLHRSKSVNRLPGWGTTRRPTHRMTPMTRGKEPSTTSNSIRWRPMHRLVRGGSSIFPSFSSVADGTIQNSAKSNFEPCLRSVHSDARSSQLEVLIRKGFGVISSRSRYVTSERKSEYSGGVVCTYRQWSLSRRTRTQSSRTTITLGAFRRLCNRISLTILTAISSACGSRWDCLGVRLSSYSASRVARHDPENLDWLRNSPFISGRGGIFKGRSFRILALILVTIGQSPIIDECKPRNAGAVTGRLLRVGAFTASNNERHRHHHRRDNRSS